MLNNDKFTPYMYGQEREKTMSIHRRLSIFYWSVHSENGMYWISKFWYESFQAVTTILSTKPNENSKTTIRPKLSFSFRLKFIRYWNKKNVVFTRFHHVEINSTAQRIRWCLKNGTQIKLENRGKNANK